MNLAGSTGLDDLRVNMAVAADATVPVELLKNSIYYTLLIYLHYK